MQVRYIVHPDSPQRLGDVLAAALTSGQWTSFRAGVAFLKRSGATHLTDPLRHFSLGGNLSISVGIDHGGTTMEGLRSVFSAIQPRGRMYICHNRRSSTFHPKVHLFESESRGMALVGSGNWTEGGLFTNYEAIIQIDLDKSLPADREVLAQINNSLALWSDPQHRLAVPVTPEFLAALEATHTVPTELEAAEQRARATQPQPSERQWASGEPEVEYFASIAVPPAPVSARPNPRPRPSSSPRPPLATSSRPIAQLGRSYLMTLQRTDVGRGQTTRGTSPRSPEIFIPLAARDMEPNFWGWPDLFTEDYRTPGKFDRTEVAMSLNGQSIWVNMMTWPAKHDFRLRCSELRSSGEVDDLMIVTASTGSLQPAYNVRVCPQGDPSYQDLLRHCTHPVRNSRKRFGYTSEHL